jgi:hypothetical protein
MPNFDNRGLENFGRNKFLNFDRNRLKNWSKTRFCCVKDGKIKYRLQQTNKSKNTETYT